ncbi:uncharacterized protein LOC135483215 isoform X2 [Lineus longissimus]
MTATHSVASDQSAIYRSIPANPRDDSLYDLYARTVMNLSPQPYTRNQAAAPISSMEYAKRINARPTTTPKVVGFDSGSLRPQPLKRGIEGFFPSVKLSGSAKSTTTTGSKTPLTPTIQSPASLSFEIAPSPELTAHYYRNKTRRKSSKSNTSFASLDKVDRSIPDIALAPTSLSTEPDTCIRRYPYYTQTYPNVLPKEDNKPVGGDLSYLPRPKNFLARRDVPWIYRYKVKKNMNQLSKIMASKSDHCQAEELVKT